jgi:hypothetical protein
VKDKQLCRIEIRWKFRTLRRIGLPDFIQILIMEKNNNITSDISESVPAPERLLIELVMGTRVPVTDYEKKLHAEINEMKRQGQIVEIPFDI